MAKIIGNIITTPYPRPDWNQTNETKADYIKNKPNIAALKSDVMAKISALECGVYGDIVLKDDNNDKLYSIYVSAEDLTLEETSSTLPYISLIFKDITTEANYAIYVYDGLLKMRDTLDAYTHKTITLKDKTSGKTYKIFVSNSKLTMIESDDITFEYEKRVENLEASMGNIDSTLSNIDSALDNIISMQNSLIGGEV